MKDKNAVHAKFLWPNQSWSKMKTKAHLTFVRKHQDLGGLWTDETKVEPFKMSGVKLTLHYRKNKNKRYADVPSLKDLTSECL